MSELLSHTIALLGQTDAAPGAGGLLSLTKWIVLVLGLIPWLAICQWVDKDTWRLHLKRHMWNGVHVAAGAIGLLLWLVIPYFILGLLVYAILVAGTVLTYIFLRNQVVKPASRVLTGEHLANVWGRWFGGLKPRQREEVPDVQLLTPDHQPVPAVDPDGPLGEGFQSGQIILDDALNRRAEWIALVPAGQTVKLQYTIDGVVTDEQKMDRRSADALITYLKQSAGMDVNDRRRPQEGKLLVIEPGLEREIIVRTSGSRAGESCTIEVEKVGQPLTPETMGLSERQQQVLGDFRIDEGGVLILGAADGSGATTTFYELLRAHDAFMNNIQTLEQSIDGDLENITQHEYKAEQAESSFARSLQSIIRRGPDVVGVSLCKDKETAQLIAQTATEHAKFYVQMSGKDTFTLLARWAALVGDLKLAMGPLRLVFAQTLIRKLCTECREAYRPPADLLRKINLPADRIERLYRPPTQRPVDKDGIEIVCPTCQNTGYHGRTGVFEMLVVDDELRRMVVNNASAAEMKQYCRSQKMFYLQEEALRKVISGETSINEVLRVFRDK